MAIWWHAEARATTTDEAMEPSTNAGPLIETSKRFARRLFAVGENRIELLMVEAQEASEGLLHAVLLVAGVAALCLLAGGTLTGAIVVLLWETSRVATLLVLSGLYGAAAAWLYWRLTLRLRDWQSLPATLDQLRKDRACLEKQLA